VITREVGASHDPRWRGSFVDPVAWEDVARCFKVPSFLSAPTPAEGQRSGSEMRATSLLGAPHHGDRLARTALIGN
jgi:hypothetical protein